jgi:hypothetical protein
MVTALKGGNKMSIKQMFLWFHASLTSEVPFTEKSLKAHSPETGWVKFWVPFTAAFIEWRERSGGNLRSFLKSLEVPEQDLEESIPSAETLLKNGLRQMRRAVPLPLLLSLLKEGRLDLSPEPWKTEDLEWISREEIAPSSRFNFLSDF